MTKDYRRGQGKASSNLVFWCFSFSIRSIWTGHCKLLWRENSLLLALISYPRTAFSSWMITAVCYDGGMKSASSLVANVDIPEFRKEASWKSSCPLLGNKQLGFCRAEQNEIWNTCRLKITRLCKEIITWSFCKSCLCSCWSKQGITHLVFKSSPGNFISCSVKFISEQLSLTTKNTSLLEQ